MERYKVFTTSGSREIAQKIFPYLKKYLGNRLKDARIAKHATTWFSNQNPEVKILENVRRCQAIVIHTQGRPVDDDTTVSEQTIELIALLDALREAKVDEIFMIFPYMPFQRSDRKNKPRISVMGKTFPRLLERLFDIKYVLLVDPHNDHLKHYFSWGADEITGMYLMADAIERRIIRNETRKNFIVMFADTGSLHRYKKIAHMVKVRTGFIDKDRPDNDERPEVEKLVGDVRGKKVILIDDEILTGGTLVKDSQLIMRAGAKEISAACLVHPIFESREVECKYPTRRQAVAALIGELELSPIKKFIVGNTVPIDEKFSIAKKMSMVRMEKFIAFAIAQLVLGRSLSILHTRSIVPKYRL